MHELRDRESAAMRQLTISETSSDIPPMGRLWSFIVNCTEKAQYVSFPITLHACEYMDINVNTKC